MTMFQDPNELTARLDDFNGKVVALRKLADGSEVTREIEGQSVTRTPILVQAVVVSGNTATSHTTLIFPDALIKTVSDANGFVLGKLVKQEHPKNPEWTLWVLETISGATRDKAVSAIEKALA